MVYEDDSILCLSFISQLSLERLAERHAQELRSLFKFTQGAAHLWDVHEINLAKKERHLQEQLEECRRKHDNLNQVGTRNSLPSSVVESRRKWLSCNVVFVVFEYINPLFECLKNPLFNLTDISWSTIYLHIFAGNFVFALKYKSRKIKDIQCAPEKRNPQNKQILFKKLWAVSLLFKRISNMFSN